MEELYLMKATGIIRRIDDLGRVVIPKEIRRRANIREGDPLEIFIENECVCFSKYQSNEITRISDAFQSLADFAEDEGGFRTKNLVLELQAEVEEKLKEIFV